jgi:hypothetical protein
LGGREDKPFYFIEHLILRSRPASIRDIFATNAPVSLAVDRRGKQATAVTTHPVHSRCFGPIFRKKQRGWMSLAFSVFISTMWAEKRVGGLLRPATGTRQTHLDGRTTAMAIFCTLNSLCRAIPADDTGWKRRRVFRIPGRGRKGTGMIMAFMIIIMVIVVMVPGLEISISLPVFIIAGFNHSFQHIHLDCSPLRKKPASLPIEKGDAGLPYNSSASGEAYALSSLPMRLFFFENAFRFVNGFLAAPPYFASG